VTSLNNVIIICLILAHTIVDRSSCRTFYEFLKCRLSGKSANAFKAAGRLRNLKGCVCVVYVVYDHVGLTSLLLLYNQQRTPYAYETKRRHSFNAGPNTRLPSPLLRFSFRCSRSSLKSRIRSVVVLRGITLSDELRTRKLLQNSCVRTR
jgi:hypothetical protein